MERPGFVVRSKNYLIKIDSIIMKPLLTICYYSYNDSQYWYPNVLEALKIKDSRFQIVVQDNASTDNSVELANRVEDPRFIFRRNETNLGPSPNAIKAIQNNNSIYSMVAMSRDRLNGNEIIRFLDFLEKNNPDYGFLEIWYEKNDGNFITYEEGRESLLHSYMSLHPTSYFWRQHLIDKETSLFRFKNIPSEFDFPFELINGAASVNNKLTVANILLFTPRTLIGNERKTYYNSDNLFFSPKKRIYNMKVFINHIDTLEIGDVEKEEAITKIVLQATDFIIRWYNKIHSEGNEHYGLESKNLSLSFFYNNLQSLLRTLDECEKYTKSNINIKHIRKLVKIKGYKQLGGVIMRRFNLLK